MVVVEVAAAAAVAAAATVGGGGEGVQEREQWRELTRVWGRAKKVVFGGEFSVCLNGQEGKGVFLECV